MDEAKGCDESLGYCSYNAEQFTSTQWTAARVDTARTLLYKGFKELRLLHSRMRARF